jgi:hypothetical protein
MVSMSATPPDDKCPVCGRKVMRLEQRRQVAHTLPLSEGCIQAMNELRFVATAPVSEASRARAWN